jgi:fermentation-respiration switch protein FrsA (DUF1100 family)
LSFGRERLSNHIRVLARPGEGQTFQFAFGLEPIDDQVVPFADAGLLQSKLIKGATLKVYKGAPHGLCTTQKENVNADLLAFLTI